ncbi:MAG: bifunctional 5,10-methylenetetrahydrofolate dehydrogenase/5,10-methenyltetrahydrofolate cyclohydrolase [Candidatus Limnocylindrales bacterium]
MTAVLLPGTPIAAAIREQVRADVEAFRRRRGHVPVLAVLALGRDPAFAVYARQILRACAAVGLEGREARVRGRVSPASVRRALAELNADPHVAGVIVQHPVPASIPLRTILDELDPGKDVDGVTPVNAGLVTLGYPAFAPATAEAVVEILDRSGPALEGLHAVIVGRSRVVGRPVAQLLLQRHATVTICHSRTRDLGSFTRQADVLVVAAGRPGLVTGSMVKPGAVVIDVGINVVDGRIVGDVEASSAAEVAAALTPVPGGVGPVTNAVLVRHVIRAAEQLAKMRPALP